MIDKAEKGEDVEVVIEGRRIIITAEDEIPFGHKIALKDIKEGERVIKYGEPIGRATRDIRKGEHVHVHNLKSMMI
ncbi:MAG: hypothetical protein B6U65_00645 [Candidatus Wolframiiraptor sp. EX4484-121]|nr:MAG: hypothetical protein B6U65_00645 [Candidatus Wolframiiraptor sp. EX4484-121]